MFPPPIISRIFLLSLMIGLSVRGAEPTDLFTEISAVRAMSDEDADTAVPVR
jgi:hypothetical protein